MKKRGKSTDEDFSFIEKILKGTPLRTRIFIHLQMDDIANWNNGTYSGDVSKLKDTTNHLVTIFKEFYEHGMPQGFKLIEDADSLPKNTGLVSVSINS